MGGPASLHFSGPEILFTLGAVFRRGECRWTKSSWKNSTEGRGAGGEKQPTPGGTRDSDTLVMDWMGTEELAAGGREGRESVCGGWKPEQAQLVPEKAEGRGWGGKEEWATWKSEESEGHWGSATGR